MTTELEEELYQIKSFHKLCLDRHIKGAKVYGAVEKNFEKDFCKEIIEELADATNYLSYLYMKIIKIQKKIDEKIR